MDFGGLGQVISGDKPVKAQIELKPGDIQIAALYFTVGMFIAVLLANFITRKQA